MVIRSPGNDQGRRGDLSGRECRGGLLCLPHGRSGPAGVASEGGCVGFVAGKLDAHRARRAVLQALAGQVRGPYVLVAPASDLGQDIPRRSLGRPCLAQEQQASVPVSASFMVVVQVA